MTALLQKDRAPSKSGHVSQALIRAAVNLDLLSHGILMPVTDFSIHSLDCSRTEQGLNSTKQGHAQHKELRLSGMQIMQACRPCLHARRWMPMTAYLQSNAVAVPSEISSLRGPGVATLLQGVMMHNGRLHHSVSNKWQIC